MKRQKNIMILACMLIVGLLPFLYYSHFTQTRQVSETEKRQDFKEPTEENKEAIGKEVPNETSTERVAEIVPATEEEIQQSADEENNSQTITEKLTEKVREAIKGTISLFKKDLRIVSIGDSLTEGIGDQTESSGYVGILNHTFEDNQLNISIENYGKKGNRTDQLLKRLDQDDVASSIKKADVMLITIGGNDVMKVVKDNFLNLTTEPFNREREEFKERLRAIFHKTKELNPDAHIYLIGFYNPFEQYFSNIGELGMIMTNWNEAGKAVTEEFEHVSYIPTADLFVPSDTELLADDHFHPNTTGYKRMAQRILEEIDEIEIDTTEITIANN
ncbi:SGNH/GDSL hydrolase family protein [Lederbergia panacisoli]|uniref:SGNH/GDSL hydrolase family protein n=1 Tax=Lederbergia panacisoli TaxID=1255251 RepID=UPI00214B7BA0|nr:SGNH/GDSL hydrolase family protein [Lederbergia panacisoli]MCR2823607.1 SGNH/GDSL hydrolase family protein [Lederbergia panacisoli]